MIFNANGTRAIPIECAFAIIEVKTSLSTAELKAFCDKLREVRSFDRTAFKPGSNNNKIFTLSEPPQNIFPVLGYVFAIESSARLETLQGVLQGLMDISEAMSLPNSVYVNGRGCIAYHGPGSPYAEGAGWISFPNSRSRVARNEGSDSFLLFIGLMLDLLLVVL